MSGLARRIETLEKRGGPYEWALVLDRMSLTDLHRLRELVVARDAGEWPELSDDDFRLLAELQAEREAMTGVPRA